MAEWQDTHDLWRSMFQITFTSKSRVHSDELHINPEYLEIDSERVIVSLRSRRERRRDRRHKRWPKHREYRNSGWQALTPFTRLLRLRIIDYYREENAVFLKRLDEDLKKEDDTILRLFQTNRVQSLYPERLTIENHKNTNIAEIIFNYDATNGYVFKVGVAFPPLTMDRLVGLAYTPVVSLASVFRLFIINPDYIYAQLYITC